MADLRPIWEGAPGLSAVAIKSTILGCIATSLDKKIADKKVTVRYIQAQPNFWDDGVEAMLTHASIVAAGCLVQADPNYEIDNCDVQLIALGDAFGLVDAIELNVARKQYLDGVVAAMVANQRLPRVPVDGFAQFGVTNNIYGNIVREGEVPAEGAPNHEVNFANNTLLPLTFGQAFSYVENNLAVIKEEFEVMNATEALATAIVSVCKTGTVHRILITRIIHAINTELNVQIELSSSLIRRFYSAFVCKKRFTPATAQAFFERTLLMVPQSALRVRLTIELICDHGITGLLMVSKALINYPDFKWFLLDIIRPGEILAVTTALHQWDGNHYAGFSRNLQNIYSTNYKLAVYTAKKLHMECGGMSSLKMYRGRERGPITIIDNAVDAYRENRENTLNAIDNEQGNTADAVPEMLRSATVAATAMVNLARERADAINAINFAPV